MTRLSPTFQRTALGAAMTALAFSVALPAAQAQSCDGAPAFAAYIAPNGLVRASATRLERGDFRAAAHFGRQASESGASRLVRAAGYANACAGLAQLGDAGALAACDAAVELRDDAWQTHNNRGAALWLAGDHAGARASFAAAAALAPGESAVAANMELANCAHTG